LTVHQFGQGLAYYLATQASNELVAGLIRQLCQRAAVLPVLETPAGVEATKRVKADGRVVYFLLNHNDRAEQVALPAGVFTSLLTGEEVEGQIEMGAKDVVVLLVREIKAT